MCDPFPHAALLFTGFLEHQVVREHPNLVRLSQPRHYQSHLQIQQEPVAGLCDSNVLICSLALQGECCGSTPRCLTALPGMRP